MNLKNESHPNTTLNYNDFNGLFNNLRSHIYETLSDPIKFKNSNIKSATLWLTDKCNSTCSYCYQDGSAYGSGIAYDEAFKIINFLHEEGYYVYPVVNEWLPQYWKYLELLKYCGIKQIATNGTIIAKKHKDFLPLLKEYNIEDIRVTLFPKTQHTYYTGRKREMATDAIKLLKKNGFDVVINYLVTKDTLPLMQEAIEESIALNVNEIFFQNFIYSGRAKQFRDAILTYEDIDIFWETFGQLETKYKDESLLLNFQGNFGTNPIGDNMYKRAAGYCNYCVAGKWKYLDQIYISPTKEIYPCMMLNNKHFKMGDVIIKNGKVALSYKNEKHWETTIPGFDRSSCASLMYMQDEVKKNQDCHINA